MSVSGQPEVSFPGVDVALARADRLANAGRLDEARAIVASMSQAHPNSHELLTAHGRLCLISGRREEGATLLLRSLELVESQPLVHLNIGLLYKGAGHLSDARRHLDRATTLDESLLSAWLARIELADSEGDWLAALRCVQRVAAGFPEQRALGRRDFLMRIAARVWEKASTPAEVLDAVAQVPLGFESVVGAIWPALRDPPSREGGDALVTRAAKVLESHNFDSADCMLLAVLLRHLKDSGWYREGMAAPFRLSHFLVMVEDRENRSAAVAALDVLGYHIGSDVGWNQWIFEQYVEAAFRRWPSAGDVSVAIGLEERTAFSLGQQPHTEEQARRCYQALQPHFARITAGEQLRRSELHVLPGKAVVAFLSSLPIVGCAPDKVILRLCMGLSADDPEFVSVIASTSSVSDAMRASFESLGAAIVDMDRITGRRALDQGFHERMKALHRELLARGVGILVYYHCTDGFAIAAAPLQIAPVQVYYSMGYHYLDGPFWDGLVAIGAAGESTKDFNGHEWHATELTVEDPLEGDIGRQRRAAATEVRRQWEGKAILGTIARPQKIDSDEFIDALARILQGAPEAVYLWFGPEELGSVRQRMSARGIADRCYFMGWVDSPTYALALDVHLDSFPFPTGLTMFESMGAGCAAVFMDVPEARATGVVLHIAPLLEGTTGDRKAEATARHIFRSGGSGADLFLLARDADEYVSHVLRLVADPALRQSVGAANREFVKAFKGDPRVAARSFSRVLDRILAGVREKRSRETTSNSTTH